MKRWTDAANAAAFVFALLASSAGAVHLSSRAEPQVVRPPKPAIPAQAGAALRDAQGTEVPLRSYRRIASATLLADRALADLVELDRVVAFSRYASEGQNAHRFAGKPAIGARDPIERILALSPDLLLVSELFEASYVARLRGAGIAVFDLGPMRGVDSLITAVHRIGALAAVEERAAAYAAALQRRLSAVSRDGARPERTRALYLSRYGDRLFGGAAATTYHDVISFAGLRDVAAEAGLEGWPDLPADRLLALDPDLLVTRTGGGRAICRFPGLSALRPCRGAGLVIELEGALLDDPGPGMLDAAEALRAAALAR